MKKIIIITIIILAAIQFIRPAKNQTTEISPNAISAKYDVPEQVQSLLKTSCYDCHSNNTQYPWYSHIQPVAWWLNSHIQDGKRHLNFDAFETYSIAQKKKKLTEIIEAVGDGSMPLSSYTLIHQNATLTPTQQGQITDWAKALKEKL